MFAIIDGHRGIHVAEFIKKHLMDVVFRNENIMVNRYFSIGLKQVFIKLDEIMNSPPVQQEMRYVLGWPDAKKGSLFLPSEDLAVREREENLAWKCGAALTIVIVNTDQVFCAGLGDCRAVAHTVRG